MNQQIKTWCQASFGIVAVMLSACTQSAQRSAQSFWLGTYTDGESRGIYRGQLHSDGRLEVSHLAIETPNPSFLAKSADGRFLLAVNELDENGTGYVSSFGIGGDLLTEIDQQPTSGAHPCHVAIDQRGHVLSANYTGGSISLHQMGADGLLGRGDTLAFSGKGVSDRQEAPHLHSVWFDPGRDRILAVDLGTDRLHCASIGLSDEGIPRFGLLRPIGLPPGAGPRHLVFCQDRWIYVLNELNSTISQIDLATDSIMGSYTTLPQDFAGHNQCADIHLSQDCRFLYASNRGHNSLACYAIDPQSGHLSLIQHIESGGDWPRNFAISPDDRFVVVAHERSSSLVSFGRDLESGFLTKVSEAKAPKPVCVLFD